MDDSHTHEDPAEDLLRSALLDASVAAAVSLTVGGLPLSHVVTVIFHGRRDLGTVQTYITLGERGAGDAIGGRELLRVPCDLDLGAAEDREHAERLYYEQACALRDALLSADTVLAVWREPLSEIADSAVMVDRSLDLSVALPAYRLMPVALVAPERRIVVTPVCGARTLAEGRPPMGIACAQQDVARVYPLPDDPERCLEDFFELAAGHARQTGQRIAHQEASVERFLEISGDDFPRAG